MSKSRTEGVIGLAASAFDILKRHSIPPYPQFFELIFDYEAGRNPELKSAMEAVFKADSGLAANDVRSLLDGHIQPKELASSSLPERMRDKMDAMQDAVDAAMTSASSFSGSLDNARENLERGISVPEMKALTIRLLDETRHTQAANRALEEKIASSREDLVQLQRDLALVRREAMLDPLTRIANRKCFEETLGNFINEARGSVAPLALLMIDIDHFKRFNDQFGHQTGDQVLRLVATTLKSTIRDSDLAARYGGEEFVVVLPETELDGAMFLAEKIRRSVYDKKLLRKSTNEIIGRVTASIGVGIYRAGETADQFVDRVDGYLYEAKRHGRNCVVGNSTFPKAARET
ncbi:GGDEF domain-containing protein [uncultured Devosia sp.]|uniref:GGDEF domain-containing protein n=1 Tax=uncultured Devosia sp. TaxID=211434 RepID=UPI0030EBAE12